MRKARKNFLKKKRSRKPDHHHKRNKSDLGYGYLKFQNNSLSKNKLRPNLRRIAKNPFCSDLEISKLSRSKKLNESSSREHYNNILLLEGGISPEKKHGAFWKMKEFEGLAKTRSLKPGPNHGFGTPGSEAKKRKFSINAIGQQLNQISESPLEKDNASRNYNSTKKKRSQFGALLSGSTPKKAWHQLSPNTLVLDPNLYELNSSNIKNILHAPINVKKFALTDKGSLAILASEEGEVMMASLDTNEIIGDFNFKFKKVPKEIFGLEIDYENKVWVASDKKLVVLNQKLRKRKQFLIEDDMAYSTISLPDERFVSLQMNFNKLRAVWFKGNEGILTYDTKKMEVVAVVKSVVNLIEIEQLIGFQITPNCKDAVYMTHKSMLGETSYLLNLEKGLLKDSWKFTNTKLKGQETCTCFATDEKQQFFIFGGYYLKFGEKKPFISVYCLGARMEHMDTKGIDNAEGEVSHIFIDGDYDKKGIKIAVYVAGDLIVMSLRDYKLEYVKCVKDLHVGTVVHAVRFRSKIVSCGPDRLIRSYDIGFGH